MKCKFCGYEGDDFYTLPVKMISEKDQKDLLACPNCGEVFIDVKPR